MSSSSSEIFFIFPAMSKMPPKRFGALSELFELFCCHGGEGRKRRDISPKTEGGSMKSEVRNQKSEV